MRLQRFVWQCQHWWPSTELRTLKPNSKHIWDNFDVILLRLEDTTVSVWESPIQPSPVRFWDLGMSEIVRQFEQSKLTTVSNCIQLKHGMPDMKKNLMSAQIYMRPWSNNGAVFFHTSELRIKCCTAGLVEFYNGPSSLCVFYMFTWVDRKLGSCVHANVSS